METKLDNPMGTDGFEFLEFATPDPAKLKKQFEQMGFTHVGNHKSKKVALYQQGDINFILNEENNTQASKFYEIHGAGCCAMGFRVKDAKKAMNHALAQGAKPYQSPIAKGELEIPAIEGIGDTVIYFVDRYENETIYDVDFELKKHNKTDLKGVGLTYIDHLTHNVHRGYMDTWAEFYYNIFNFNQIRFFDIKGKMTGLISRALGSPCGKIKIPLNEATDDQSQIEEFIREFNGEGIQHIALGTSNIYDSIERMRANELKFLDTPDTYFEQVDTRVPDHEEDLVRMQKNKILIDGDAKTDEGLLLQIFTENMLGPVFFEIIQRKGNEGFGEGNFQALFDSIELDQVRRGVLKTDE